jgi:hypothetical protein
MADRDIERMLRGEGGSVGFVSAWELLRPPDHHLAQRQSVE